MLPTRLRNFSTALLIIFGVLLSPSITYGLGQKQYVETTDKPDNFAIVRAGRASPIYVDENDYPGVQRAVQNLQSDIDRVTGCTPALFHKNDSPGSDVIVVGTLGKSALIDRLVREGKIDVSAIKGKWESFTLQ